MGGGGGDIVKQKEQSQHTVHNNINCKKEKTEERHKMNKQKGQQLTKKV